MVEIRAIFNKVTIKKEGDAQVIFDIPESDVIEAAKLGALRERILYLRIFTDIEPRNEGKVEAGHFSD